MSNASAIGFRIDGNQTDLDPAIFDVCYRGDTVEKVENSAAPKISRRSVFRCFRRCKPLQDRYEDLRLLLCESMWSLTSPRVGRTSGAEKFRSLAKKEFFTSIGQTE